MSPRLPGAEAATWVRLGRGHQGPRREENHRTPGSLPLEPRLCRLGGGAACAPHCVDNRNHKIAITVSEAVNKEDRAGF